MWRVKSEASRLLSLTKSKAKSFIVVKKEQSQVVNKIRAKPRRVAMSTPTLDKATVQLVPKPHTTSPVWKHFALEVAEKGKVKKEFG